MKFRNHCFSRLSFLLLFPTIWHRSFVSEINLFFPCFNLWCLIILIFFKRHVQFISIWGLIWWWHSSNYWILLFFRWFLFQFWGFCAAHWTYGVHLFVIWLIFIQILLRIRWWACNFWFLYRYFWRWILIIRTFEFWSKISIFFYTWSSFLEIAGCASFCFFDRWGWFKTIAKLTVFISRTYWSRHWCGLGLIGFLIDSLWFRCLWSNNFLFEFLWRWNYFLFRLHIPKYLAIKHWTSHMSKNVVNLSLLNLCFGFLDWWNCFCSIWRFVLLFHFINNFLMRKWFGQNKSWWLFLVCLRIR